MAKSITEIIEAYRPSLEKYEELYKHFHAMPELSGQESATAGVVAKHLKELGFSVITNIGGHGLVGLLENKPGKTVLLRADMDALPIEEKTELPYASKHRMVDLDGVEKPVMHACGHDMHVSSLLAAAHLLYTARNDWHGTLIALFQPAEERGSGARAMVDDHLYERVPRPDVVLGGHVGPGPSGSIGTRLGIVASAADSYKITMFGKGGHGSQPHLTVDPIVMAAHLVIRLQTIVSREVDPFQSAVVTVGSLRAGLAENIIPDEAALYVNIRTFDDQTRERVLAAVRRMALAEAQASSSPRDPLIEPISSFPPLRNDVEVTETLYRSFDEHFGGFFRKDMEKVYASEDFGELATAINVPSCFWMYGSVERERWDDAVSKGTTGEIPANHSSLFAPVVQPTLKTAADGYAVAALTWLTDGASRGEGDSDSTNFWQNV